MGEDELIWGGHFFPPVLGLFVLVCFGVFCFVFFLVVSGFAFCGGLGKYSTQLCPKNNMYKTLKCDVGMCECVFVNVWQFNLCLLEVSDFPPFSGSICYKICKQKLYIVGVP